MDCNMPGPPNGYKTGNHPAHQRRKVARHGEKDTELQSIRSGYWSQLCHYYLCNLEWAMLPHCHEPSSHIYKIEDIEIDQKGQQHGIRTTLLLLSSIADTANQSQFTFHWSRVQLHKPYHSLHCHSSVTDHCQANSPFSLFVQGREKRRNRSRTAFILKSLPCVSWKSPTWSSWYRKPSSEMTLVWKGHWALLVPGHTEVLSSEWAGTLRKLARDHILSEAPLGGHHQDLVGKGAAALFLGTLPKTLRYLLDCGNFFLVVRTPVSGSPDSCLHLDCFGLVSCSGKGNWGMIFPGRCTIRWNKATDFIDSF